MKTNSKVLLILSVIGLLLVTENVFGLEKDSLRVSGIITDSSGDPLPGVSVVVKGTMRATCSDIDGKYSLTVPENTVLEFSFIGFASQKITVGTQQAINVVLLEGFKVGIKPAQPVKLTEKQQEKAEIDNRFAFKMFREVSKQQGDNTFFSPFSLNMALGMLYTGSSGSTRTEIAKAFNIAGISENEINEYYRTTMQALLHIDPMTDINIANSIWYHDRFPVKNTFIETCQDYFDADVQALDFNNSNAANRINSWCADKTHNRINQIVHSIPNDVVMYLINAIYFKSKWQEEKTFHKEKTKWDDFTKTNKEKIKAHLMEQTTTLPYYADQHLQCVELPYGNQAFSMIAILPPEGTNINCLIDYLPTVQWQDIVTEMREERVWLKLPRFKIECDIPLNQPVMNVGMKKIFSKKFADFVNIADITDTLLCVSNIRQKTFVEVNEEGTEAAATTAIEMMVTGIGVQRKPEEPVRFFADRPFLFLIREKSTGVILFIGRVDEPHE